MDTNIKLLIVTAATEAATSSYLYDCKLKGTAERSKFILNMAGLVSEQFRKTIEKTIISNMRMTFIRDVHEEWVIDLLSLSENDHKTKYDNIVYFNSIREKLAYLSTRLKEEIDKA